MTVGEYIAHYVESLGQHQLKTIDLHLSKCTFVYWPFQLRTSRGYKF